jgi:ketosteroid isomerase-like protein
MGGNIELIHHAVGCFNNGDWETLAESFAPDCLMTPLDNWPEPGPFVGRAANVAQFQRLREDTGGRSKIEVVEMRERGDWVVTQYRWVMEGAASGAVVEAAFTGVGRYEDGHVLEQHFRFEEAKALEAAGLSATDA